MSSESVSAENEDIDSEQPTTTSQMEFPKRRRRDPIFFGDFKESDLDDVQKRKRFWKVAHHTIAKSRRNIRYYQCIARRQKKKIKSLNLLLDELMEKEKISSQQLMVLKESIPEVQKAILFRHLKKGIKGGKYSPQLRCFALTLNFYSSSAYQYVRKVFGKNSLPHPRTLTKWYSTVDGTPGFSAEAIRAVKMKVDIKKGKGKQLAGLVIDEMSIREHVHWTGSRNVGYIDYGTGMQNSDQLPHAKHVFVIMLVGYNTRWKVSIAYFLVDALSAEEKAMLIKGSFLQLETTGVLIKSITFDGCASNISMANLLGAKLSFPGMKPYFINPVNKEKVHIILDACHMIKLVRNTLGDWGILCDGNGDSIKWYYFKELVKLQEESGLHCATRLRSRHINYYKEKMKVKLAVQTFSASVGDALEYCNQDLNITKFRGSEATVSFCRKINNICKRPLFKGNSETFKNFIKESVEYLSSLTDQKHDKVTYKLSQDHLEMFFSAIRSRGDFSNNPTAWHFENAYKRLLIHSEITTSDSTNCLAQDNTSILNVTIESKNNSIFTTDLLYEQTESSDAEDELFIKNYNTIANCTYICDIVEYIAGFISKKLVKALNCNECANALTSDNSLSLLLNKKNRGGLCKPSRDVVKVCICAEGLIK
ncbi:unnamed protein product [Acanthoscelides obtectus]|uniref:THAP domain-containing protein 9 n=1 Tax=Acanthoscelides obtectus TaxID=200917 RepID=A0A9P0LSW5_ACAOB|nr:unnamed protein product [Acanthoscelides obtectus]CAK1624292.1 DNA transposase THAP9 [Acanthoscelides obtectus]